METLVKVSNFSSVLEIAFAINLVFLVLEMKPIFDREWRGLYRRFNVIIQYLWDMSNLRYFFIATGYQILYMGITLFTTILSGSASAGSLGLLIASGFEPDLTLDAEKMRYLLVGLFAPTPTFVLFSWCLMKAARKHLSKMEQRYTSTS